MSTCAARLMLILLAAVALSSCESSVPPLAPNAVTGDFAHSAGDPHGTASRKPSAGESIVIKHGELDIAGLGGEVRLKDQTREFFLTAGVTRSGGVASAFTACFASNCAPGDSIPLSATWGGNDFHATVTLDGITYTRLGDLSGRYGNAWISFSGSVVAPPLNSRGSAKVTAPFTMEGGFWVPDHPSMLYSGGGVVTVWLAHEPWASGWRVTRLLYEFRNQPPRVGSDHETE